MQKRINESAKIHMARNSIENKYHEVVMFSSKYGGTQIVGRYPHSVFCDIVIERKIQKIIAKGAVLSNRKIGGENLKFLNAPNNPNFLMIYTRKIEPAEDELADITALFDKLASLHGCGGDI